MKQLQIKTELKKQLTTNKVSYLANPVGDYELGDSVELIDEGNEAFAVGSVEEVVVKKFVDYQQESATSNPQNTNNFSEAELEPGDPVQILKLKVTVYDNPIKQRVKNSVEEVKVFGDGGSRGNPGPSALGYVITTSSDEIIKRGGIYLGVGTNNQAEYKSLKVGLEEALKLGAKRADVFMDSQLVVKQLLGEYKVKSPDLWPIYRQVCDLADKFERITFTHIPRRLNSLADAEVNKSLDSVEKP